mmetsp:Transcript_2051/g.3855  ORF Transcript_2051/g.3855 Transcript_2051/m.3855 type:complete len:98 (+) Transcript_2051:462-755(+)
MENRSKDLVPRRQAAFWVQVGLLGWTAGRAIWAVVDSEGARGLLEAWEVVGAGPIQATLEQEEASVEAVAKMAVVEEVAGRAARGQPVGVSGWWGAG